MQYNVELYEKVDGKTPETPKKELDVALERMKEYLRREKK
jgi:phage-related protein